MQINFLVIIESLMNHSFEFILYYNDLIWYYIINNQFELTINEINELLNLKNVIIHDQIAIHC